MAQNKVEIKSKDLEGKEVTVYVTRPTDEDYKKAQIASNTAFKDAVMSGAMLRSKLNEFMLEQGLWDDKKQKRLEELENTIRDNLVKLKSGGIKLTEGKEMALEIRSARMERTLLEAKRQELDEYTVESQAENARFDYLVSVCVKDKKGKPIFKDLDDYKQKGTEPYASEAAGALANMLYGLDQDWESNLPENKFLKKFKFVDEKLRLVDKDGNYITKDGKRIDENYRYIDENGNFVDADGNPVDEDGLPIVETQPFLDDDGNPIVVEEE